MVHVYTLIEIPGFFYYSVFKQFSMDWYSVSVKTWCQTVFVEECWQMLGMCSNRQTTWWGNQISFIESVMCGFQCLAQIHSDLCFRAHRMRWALLHGLELTLFCRELWPTVQVFWVRVSCYWWPWMSTEFSVVPRESSTTSHSSSSESILRIVCYRHQVLGYRGYTCMYM